MSISKSESASESAERDYEAEGAGDFREERDLPEERELREDGGFGAAEDPRATTLSTAEPAATIDHDAEQDSATDRDEALSEDSMSGDAVQTQPQSTPMQPTAATPTAQSPLATDPGPVLAPEASLDFRERWHGIQAEFIDDPRRAVEDADRLLADVARAFTASVEERRRGLTSGWEHDGHGETEELRLAMRQYRALVDHILQD